MIIDEIYSTPHSSVFISRSWRSNFETLSFFAGCWATRYSFPLISLVDYPGLAFDHLYIVSYTLQGNHNGSHDETEIISRPTWA